MLPVDPNSARRAIGAMFLFGFGGAWLELYAFQVVGMRPDILVAIALVTVIFLPLHIAVTNTISQHSQQKLHRRISKGQVESLTLLMQVNGLPFSLWPTCWYTLVCPVG